MPVRRAADRPNVTTRALPERAQTNYVVVSSKLLLTMAGGTFHKTYILEVSVRWNFKVTELCVTVVYSPSIYEYQLENVVPKHL